MDLLEQLEYPLPILKADTEKIVIETDGIAGGKIIVSNAGGGILSGRVLSNSPSFRFINDSFEGNSVRLEYEANVSGLNQGDIIRTDAVIMSNGGEKTLPVIIKALTRVLETPDAHKIAGLKDFLSYSKKNPESAKRIFYTKTFKSWLSEIGYEYMDIFEIISQDTVAERAIENFFILNKQKNRPIITLLQDTIEHDVDPVDINAITGIFKIKKSGWGYIEFPITVSNYAPWLAVKPDVITQASFGEDDNAEINYIISPMLIELRSDKARINIGDFAELTVKIRKKPLFDCYVIRESYGFDDSGTLVIINNSKADVLFEVTPSDTCIKFDGKRYLVGSRGEVSFKTKLSGIQAAQFAIRRQNFIEAEIMVRCGFEKSRFKKSIRISICDRRNER